MMKTITRLAAILSLSVALFSCSEGNYTPVTQPNAVGAQTGYYNNNGLNNGFNPGFNNGFNPGFNNGIYTGVGVNPYFTQNAFTYNSLSAQMRVQFNTQAANMFSCAARATPNYFYFQQSQMNNCAVRRAPTYTPSSCACYQAPCNCEQVVAQVQTQCGVAYMSDHNGHPTVSSSGSSGGCSSGCGGGSTSGSTDSGINENIKTLPISIKNADAKALYIRLAKEEVDTKNSTKTKIRTGMNYKCMMDNKGKNDSDYACDIDLSPNDGTVYQMYPLGNPGVAAIVNPAIYNGTNVSIGGPGFNPDEGTIKVQGSGAAFMFKKLTATATAGTVDLAQTVQASIKLGKQVKCYQTTGTSSPVTECLVKISSTTGTAEVAN